MPEFKTIQEVEAELAKYVPIVKQITGKDITLQRTERLMKRLGNPERKLKIVHVAGTSGKTSTSYYLTALLAGSFGKVGLTVSPHIDSLTERVQVNSQPLAEAEFCKAFSEYMRIIEAVDPEPSYFEMLIGFAYWYFAEIGADYVVAETGMGGSHDATNIAQATNKICVITDIGLDHMHILGDTLPKIASQKAGIIHPGNQVYMYEQAPEVTEVFRRRCESVGAQLTLLEQPNIAERFATEGLSELPEYQQRNWLLARAVYQAVCEREAMQPSQEGIQASLRIQVPGRMDVQQAGDKTLVMDGAHNEQKMTAFVQSFKAKYPGRQATILLSLKEGKEYQAVLPLLQPICNNLIITTFNVMQDLPSRSIDPNILRDAALAKGFTDVVIEPDPAKAYDLLLQTEDDLALITGSFYLLCLVRRLIIKP